MADEKILREKLEKLVTDGYGDALEYARNEAANAAANAAIKGYNRGAITVVVAYAIIKIAVKLIRKCQGSKA